MIAAWAPAALFLAGQFAWPGAMAVDGRALADPDRPARPAAVERFVERYGFPAATAAVVPLLEDRDSGVRFVAARLLVREGEAGAIATAARWLTEPGRPAGDRAAGLEALSRAPAFTPAIRAAFEQAIRDRDPALRAQAVAALGRHDALPSLPAIVRALDDEARDVRLAAAVVIGGIARVDPARAARAALPLLERLDDPDQAVRLAALRALGSLHDPRTIPALSRVAGDEPNSVGAAAADALGSPVMAAAAPELIGLARAAPADETARHALLALGEIATPPAVAALVDALRRPAPPDEAAIALRHAGPAAVPALAAEVAGGTPTGAVRAAALLGELGDARATPALAAAVDDDDRGPAVSLAAIDALARLRDPAAVAPLARAAVAAEPPDVRRQALLALRVLGDPRAAAVLPQALADPDPAVRAAAAALAGTLRATESIPALAPLLADGDPRVRPAAAHALARITGGPSPLPAALASALVPHLLAALARVADRPGDDETATALGDALEATAGEADRARLAGAFRAAPAGAQAALARGMAAAFSGAAIDDRVVIDRLIALVAAGGTPAFPAADALAFARFSEQAASALIDAAARAEPMVVARLCPALGRVSQGGVRLAALIADPEQPPLVRAAAAWAARGLAPSRRALEDAARSEIEPLARNARAALTQTSVVGWAAVRLQAPDGTPVVDRWVLFGTGAAMVAAMTDETGVARVTGLDGRAAVSFESAGQRLQAAP